MNGRFRARGQRGQVLPILLFSLFALAVAMVVLHGIGSKTHDRIALQQSADRAALSGSIVGARAVNTLTYINEVIIYSESIEAVYRAIELHYRPIMGHLCLGSPEAPLPGQCDFAQPICTMLCTRREAIVGEARRQRARNRALLSSARSFGQWLVDNVPTLSTRYAEQAAGLRVLGATGVVDLLALSPGAGEPLPLEQDVIELRQRVEQRALGYFDDRVALLDVDVLYDPLTRTSFANAVISEARLAEGPYWDLPSGSPSSFRERVTTIAFVARNGGDIARRRAVEGVARRGSAPFADMRSADVAMAAAEMYFNRASGRPDRRPSWSARRRPLERAPHQSRPTLVDAIQRDAARGSQSLMGPWSDAVQIEPEGDPRILH